MTIEEYFSDWSKVLDLDEANKIAKILATHKGRVCPDTKDLFKAFRQCKLSDLKVVILGQDPYCDLYKGKPRATGIAFANSLDTPEKAYSPSLKVLMESVIDFTVPHGIVTFDASLESWEEQGVLMLNSALSCEQGKIGSHCLLWRPFMKSFLTNLSKSVPGIVYVLMGKDAQGFEQYIDAKSNFVYKTNHPSYYARTHSSMPSYIWEDINTVLHKQYGYRIKWYKETAVYE